MIRNGCQCVSWVSDTGLWCRSSFAAPRHNISCEFLDVNGRVNDLDLVAKLSVIVADRFYTVRTRRDDLFWTSGFQIRNVGVRQLLIHVFIAGPLRRIAIAAFPREDSEADLPCAHDLEQRSQRLLKISLKRSRAAEPNEHVVPSGIEGFERRRLHKLLALVVRQSPDVRSTLEVVVHPSEILGRVAIRHQPATRSD